MQVPWSRWIVRGLALLLLPGCNFLLPLEARPADQGSAHEAGIDTLPLDTTVPRDTVLWDTLPPDTLGCVEDQGIWQATPSTPYQNPACAATPLPADDPDCDGLPYDADYHRNQDFWPSQLNPIVFLDGFTRAGLPGWTLQGAPTWTCAAVTIPPGGSISIDVPEEAGTQYMVQVRFSYGVATSSAWKVGFSAPATRVCTLEQTAKGLRYCFKGGCDTGVSWLQATPGKPLVMQVWSLDSSHASTEVGDWCRIFPDGASPSANNLRSAVPTLVQGGTLTLFATGEELVVDQVRIFAAPTT